MLFVSSGPPALVRGPVMASIADSPDVGKNWPSANAVSVTVC